MKIRNDEKILILIFTVISIFLIIISAYLSESYIIEYLSQGYYSSNVIFFKHNDNEVFDIDNIYKNEKDILLFKELSINSDIRGVYYKGEIEKPQMKEGRFFSEDDFCDEKHYAVIGASFTDNIYEENNIKYFKYNDISYEVIGIMGYKQESKIDRACFINLNNSLCEQEGIYAIDGKNSNNINSLLEKIQNQYNITLIKRERTGIDRFFKTESFNILLIALLLCSLILTTISVSLYWIEKRKKEISILRLVGYSDLRISKVILFRYLLLEHISILLGFFIGIIIILSLNYNIISIMGNVLLLSYFLVILSCLIIVIIPIKKALKLDVNSQLRCRI